MDDEDGYPSVEVLHEIKTFNIGDKCEQLKEFLTLIWENWRYSDGFIYIPETGVLELHTYGWSGNEDIIEALKQQKTFWAYFWQSSARGGHYRFELHEFDILGKACLPNIPAFGMLVEER